MLPCASCGYVNGARQEAVRHREEHKRNVVSELGTTFDTLLNEEPSSVEQLDTLYQLLPLTIEDIRRLRENWYDLSFGDSGSTRPGGAGEGDHRLEIFVFIYILRLLI